MNVEQIAVVGLAGRFPGAPTLQQFWQNLCNGVEARTCFSDAELTTAVEPALLQYPGYVKSGFVLDGIEYFDADFFRFDAHQARITDPQQRLFLECVWEALETAGIDVTTYPGLVGVYAGASQSSYWAHARAGMAGVTGHVLAELIGNDKDYLATQTAYRLNLQGPCLSVQSACSTGLVAVHLACQSLLNHECDVALAGGVTVHVPHRVGYVHTEGSVFAADGRCCAFSAQATGMVFGNGVGVVVLKRLREALAAGDFIWAVVRGSAVNNDGARKFGFMTSSRMGQIEVITEAWSVAEVTAAELSYLETHGSGTPIGDVIEFSALATLFAGVEPSRQTCAIGAVKSNVGHLETAAGITGFIKTVLALHHQQIPPSINFATPNPDIDFAQTPLYLNTALTTWQLKPELGQQTRCAGVSSFGIGGTNAHVVLEEAPGGERKTAGQQTADSRQRAEEQKMPLVDLVFEEMLDDGIVLEETPAPEAAPAGLLTLSAKTQPALCALAQRYEDFLLQTPVVDFADVCYTAQVGRSHFSHRLSIVATSAQEAAAKIDAFLQQPAGPTADVYVGVAASTRPKVALYFTGDAANFSAWGRDLYATQPVFRQAIDQCDAIAAPYLDQPLAAFMVDSTVHGAPSASGLLYRFALEYAMAALWQAWGIPVDGVMGQGVGDYVAACVAGVFSLADGLKLAAAASQWGQTQRGQVNAVAGHIAYRAPTIPLLDGRNGRVLTGEVTNAAYWGQHLLAGAAQRADSAAMPAALTAQGIDYLVVSRSHWPAILADVGQLYGAGVAIDWGAFHQDAVARGGRRKVILPTYPFQRQRYWVDLPEMYAPQPPHPLLLGEGTASPIAETGKGATVPPPKLVLEGWGRLGGGEQAPANVRRQLYEAPKREQYERLVAYLQGVAAQLLGDHTASPAEQAERPAMPLTVGFADLGMSSLNAVLMRNQLQADLGCKLPATLVLDYPTVASLADYLLPMILPPFAGEGSDALGEASSAAGQSSRPSFIVENIDQPAAYREADVDALSLDEIAERLAAKLGIKI